jgi:uncharacterized membrane protein YhaH (DUF805 family)
MWCACPHPRRTPASAIARSGGSADDAVMSLVWASIIVALFIIWVLTIGDIIRRRLDAKTTAAWLCLVVLVPFVGAAVYWFARKPTPGELQQTVDAQRELREHSPYDRTRSR